MNTSRILFYDNIHEMKFIDLCIKMKNNDECHQAAAYLLGLDIVCRNHIDDIIDLQKDLIKPKGLHKSWQTGTSASTCRLLFNLWNGYCEDNSTANESPQTPYYYTPEHIFNCGYAPYYWQAIQLRFPEYATP